MRRVLSGVLLCLTALSVLVLAASNATSASVGTTFTVDTADGFTDENCGGASGCSLGDAIHAANGNPGKDTIAFNLPGTPPHLIVLPALAVDSFPTVSDAVVIDGGTQPGYSTAPLIEIDVSGQVQRALVVAGDNSAGTEIRGVAIYGGTSGNDNAIDFDNPGGNIVERNFIGTDVSGTVTRGRGGVAFRRVSSGDGLVSSDNMIADNVLSVSGGAAVLFDESSDNQVLRNLIGTDPTGKLARSTGTGVGIGLVAGSRRNLISQNVIAAMQFGIAISGSTGLPSSDNRIEGNRIGTDTDGELDLGNRDAGVDISGNARGNIIGGADPAARNLISGNDGSGVSLRGAGDTVVQGNLIGTDRTGTVDLGNDGAGITLAQTVGLTFLAGNVVSGNDGVFGHGIAGNPLAPGSVRVEGNRVGTNEQGTAAIPNALDGIRITGNSTASVIGGESEAQRNVISGNGGDGISLTAPSVDVLNNYIGTNKAGDQAVANSGDGIDAGGQGSRLGQPGAGNVVSGNSGTGLRLEGDGAVVEANLIGTNASGTGELGNAGSGVLVPALGRNVRIGGAADDEGNLISGNGGWGIDLAARGVSFVRGNRIGTDNEGTDLLQNDLGGINVANGIFFGDTAEIVGNVVSGNGGDGIRLTGTSSQVLENEISSNKGDGVAVVGSRATQNRISENRVSSNDGLGIDLEGDGVTPNDAGDVDSGANLKQNFPVNLQVSADGTTVTGTLNSRPSTTYRVELFANSTGVACDPSGSGEGERFLRPAQPDATLVTTDASGNRSFPVLLQTPLASGEFVTATATDPAGNTSEFSQCSQAPPRATIVVRKTTEPVGDPTQFEFTGDAPGRIGDGETIVRDDIAPGTYTASEIVPNGWDLTSIVCDDADSDRAAGTATAIFRVVADERVTCTFTNTKRGSVTLRKTTNSVVDPSKDILFVLTGSGLPSAGVSRSTLGDQDGVLEFGSGVLIPSQTYKMCETPVPAGFTSFWKLDGVIVTPYNPDASRTPPEDLGTRCYDFSISAGQARAFDVDNSRPGGDPRTTGYWKNWNRCTVGNQAGTAQKNGGAAAGFFLVEDLLPQPVGDFSVTNCGQAVKLLSKQDQAGRNKASDAAYELGSQLLAARFNLAAGAETCAAVQQAVLDGQTLLDQIDFTGAGDYLGSKSKDARRAQALSLAATLDRYNNGNLC